MLSVMVPYVSLTIEKVVGIVDFILFWSSGF